MARGRRPGIALLSAGPGAFSQHAVGWGTEHGLGVMATQRHGASSPSMAIPSTMLGSQQSLSQALNTQAAGSRALSPGCGSWTPPPALV